MKTVGAVVVSLSLVASGFAQGKHGGDRQAEEQLMKNQKIKITAGDTVLTTTLNGSQTSRDFMSLLPLTLSLEDYAGTEKISDLPKRLSTKNAPAGSDPSVSDIAYFAPWGNLAIFHKDFGYSRGLIILGRLDEGIEVFSAPGTMKVKIEFLMQGE